MAAIALPIAYGAFLLYFLREGGVRDALVRAAVAFGVAVALLTEILGVFGLLRPVPVLACWLSAIAAGLARARPSLSLSPLREGARRTPVVLRRKPIEAALVLVIAAVLGLVAIVAVASAPNSADAMTYHLPRVLYWMQQGSVDNYPAHYLNQLMLQPLAEYFVLHAFLLSGTDQFTNLVQLFGSVISVIGVSLVAGEFGAGSRGQAFAAFFCVTLPGAILQASGAKNDLLLACWLIASVYFALRWAREGKQRDLLALGAATGLALLTKGTGYLFLPALLAGVFFGCDRTGRFRLLKATPVCILGTVLLNGPLYQRNIGLSGSPLGFGSAHGDGSYPWHNDTFGVRNTISNLLRHLSEQLGGRSDEWNQSVYEFVASAHTWIGADLNAPATTWPGTQYEPPRNANHEANANNRKHLLVLAVLAVPIAWGFIRRKEQSLSWYGIAIVLALLFFCFYLKWQPFQARMLLPLFVVAGPLVSRPLERLPVVLSLLICWFLVDGSRLALKENWTRRLAGPQSVLRMPRRNGYFADLTPWNNRQSYLDTVAKAAESECEEIGIDATYYEIEYPFQALLRERNPRVRFVHVGVNNASSQYQPDPPPEPCAVLCMDCAGVAEKREAYRDVGEPFTSGKFVLFVPPR